MIIIINSWYILMGGTALAMDNVQITDKKIAKGIKITISAEEAFGLWTTHEGLLTFFGKDNKIELRPGGAFEIYFLMENPYGSRGSEGCKILSYLPGKMLSFSWNAPPSFPQIRKSSYKTWVVIEFNGISTNETELVLTHLGWPDDPAWNPVYDYFDRAWALVLEWFENSLK
jgi:uncharacterized protein YndB with AHSA1/START domain